MKALSEFFSIKKEKYTYWVAFLLLIPALFINLGKMPLVADEPTRALVALEMYISGNYTVPTINGTYYYNKPPLYNWLLAGLYHLSGHIDEWIVRLPTVLSMVLFIAVIYVFVSHYVDRKMALLVAFAYVTCGRVLFYDSFLGLIDTLFSVLIYMNFMVVYHYDKKGDYLKLFVYSYLIVTLGYFLKGLPALVFEAITLLALAMMRRRILFLFSRFHFVGVGVLIVFLIVYYYHYLQYNTIDVLLKTLVTESTKRTVVEYGFSESLIHFFTFPFETIMHFLPCTLPLLLFIKKESRRYILENDFLKYTLLILLANSFIYWLSPETRPRYLFMFLPLLFLLSFSLLNMPSNELFRKVFEKILLGLLVLFVVIPLVIPFVSVIPMVEYKALKITALFCLLLMTLIFYSKNKANRFIVFSIGLLLLRIGFDWFVIPSRLQTEPQVSFKENSVYVGQLTKGTPLYIYGSTVLNHDVSFYITRERREVLRYVVDTQKKAAFYLTDRLEGELLKGKVYHQFRIGYNDNLLYLVRM